MAPDQDAPPILEDNALPRIERGAQGGSMTDLDQAMARLEDLRDYLGKRHDQTDTRIDGIDERLGRIESRLERVEATNVEFKELRAEHNLIHADARRRLQLEPQDHGHDWRKIGLAVGAAVAALLGILQGLSTFL